MVAPDKLECRDDGVVVRYFRPTRRFDVVHEAMTFQFISNCREAHIRRCRELLSDKGLLILEEKCLTENFAEREIAKDEYKLQFFSTDHVRDKAKKVLGVGAEGAANCMHTRMVYKDHIEKILADEFSNVVQIWEACNFFGYMASDDISTLDGVLKHIPEDETKYSSFVKRWIRKG